MKAYTDYPFDTNPAGAVIEVELLAYDRNKYATVKVNGDHDEVKTGYLFRDPGLSLRVRSVQLRALPHTVGGVAPTRRQTFREIKQYKKRSTKYFLWVGGVRQVHRTLRGALRRLASVYKTEHCSLIRRRSENGGFIQQGLLEVENGAFDIIPERRRGPAAFKVAHYRKFLAAA